ncbi:glycosyltransferase [Ciceribacter sp. L1K23]|uniref:CgeB family protein n=1 Tax=Ciceribacter sp. L1K23 TaxID=2820276 RepID=UPI001B81C30D|nr:glycosyltransferase [Ciceribacter sp. L1K23]MBR0557079.1 glycosyltransferase [Ciceribacter sp. L1K23]
MTSKLDIVIVGLSLSSSWGNGHATTYRSLIRGLAEEGHRVLFLERDVPWYAEARDLAEPDFCELAYYSDIDSMISLYAERLRSADAVIVGSYVPAGIAVIDELVRLDLKRLCFYDIDTPVTLASVETGKVEYIEARQFSLFDAYFSFTGGRLLDVLRDRYGTPNPIALYCSVDTDPYHRTDDPTLWDLGYLGTYSPDRQPTLERFLIEPARRLPDKRFVVAGPQYPEAIDWPPNVERIDHLPPAEHASFYSRQRFTLNVTRADMIAAGWSPSVRLFEAAACATPVISDWWPGLDELFPEGEAIVIARTTEEVVDVLTATKEEDRKAMGETAHAIVAHSHTGRARAIELVETLRAITPSLINSPVTARQSA